MSRERKHRVAYLMSRFPKLTETFVLYEILAVERSGLDVEVYPLLRHRESKMHAEARPVVRRAHYLPFLSPEILAANWRAFRRAPLRYLGLWYEMLLGTLGSLNFFVGTLGILPKCVRFAEDMRSRGVTHVHAHFANHPALAALIVHRLTGIPYSFTAHGSDLHVERRMLDRKVADAAFVVAISSYNRELIVRECGEQVRSKIRVVHCGVDVDRIRPGRPTSGQRTFRLLCIGSLSEVKGQRHLVRACQRLLHEGVDFHCNLVGDGPLRKALAREIRQAQLDDRVQLLGPRSREEVLRLLHESDVVVLPSVPTNRGKREGIPVALMEAMAAGRPVVASRISGIPELVRSGTSGFLVSPADVRNLASALRVLSKDPVRRRQMGRAGRRWVTEHFNLEKSAAELQRMFAGSARTHARKRETPRIRSAREIAHELRTG